MDRPAAAGLTRQPTGRHMSDNVTPRTAPLTSSRRPPKILRPTLSNSSLSSQTTMSAAQFIALAREAMKNALEENQRKAAEAKTVSNELKPGVTIDLSHKKIQRFPDEVVDIIKNEIERLALSHNQISVFPSRFSECKSLRYLNVRNNVIREFPQCICELSSLEILDFGRNKLKLLPNQVSKLTSLKVLSIQKNRIETLPLYLADMASLQVLKLDGNPIRFPPKEVLYPQSVSPIVGHFQESDLDEPAITLKIKKFLKQKQISDRSEQEPGTGELSEGAETLRLTKRVFSGRFPIKVNTNEVSDVRSPALVRPPPIPSRSHYRGLSQQNSATRRPGVMPLTIGNANERLRSNSEVILQTMREQRVISQLRRMVVYPKKTSDLDTVDETKSSRYSHYRGLSHGSAMTGNQTNPISNLKSPFSPFDSVNQRVTNFQRLKSLPECKRESGSLDIDVEAAKSILYALFQVHPLIQNLLGVARDVNSKRTSLERVLYNASTHVEELDKSIHEFMVSCEEGENGSNSRSSENVRHACVTCVNAYIHALNLLQSNVEPLIENVDSRYVRTLLLLLYGSTCEVHAAHMTFLKKNRAHPRKEPVATVKPPAIKEFSNTRLKEKSTTSTFQRTRIRSRERNVPTAQTLNTQSNQNNTNSYPISHEVRSEAVSNACSPEVFRSPDSSETLNQTGDFKVEDRIFEKIFLRLQKTLELTIRVIPTVHNQFLTAMKINNQQSNSDETKKMLQDLIQKCLLVVQNAEILEYRMSSIKLKEPDLRSQSIFWELCYLIIKAFTELVIKLKEVKSVTTSIGNEVILILRPLQKAMKEISQLIQSSPWSYLASKSSSTTRSYITNSHIQTSLPITPISSNVETSNQSTLSSVNNSGPYDVMFSGNVFERADALLSINNSVASSRSSNITSTMRSIGSNDSNTLTPGSSILSPGNYFAAKYNGINKVILS